jgi:hypothetical protein
MTTEPWRCVVGRASNRKKAQRQAGPGSRQARQDPQPSAVPPQLVFGLDAMIEEARVRVERKAAARQAWYGDAEPVPADLPSWPENSLGHRFLIDYLGEAQDAPSLLTAEVPDAAVIAADPAHWNIAVSALIRAVIFDGLTLDHPAVSALLEVLAPIVTAEQAYAQAMDATVYSIGPFDDDDEPDFPELDGPVYLLGARALVEAVWTAVGDDPLSDVLGVLRPALDSVVPGLDSRVLADTLVSTFATHYRLEQPADLDELERIGHLGGNALEALVAAGTVPPGEVLRVGLTVLSALARLCLSGSASILEPTV